jgi:hypothetical protein
VQPLIELAYSSSTIAHIPDTFQSRCLHLRPYHQNTTKHLPLQASLRPKPRSTSFSCDPHRSAKYGSRFQIFGHCDRSRAHPSWSRGRHPWKRALEYPCTSSADHCSCSCSCSDSRYHQQLFSCHASTCHMADIRGAATSAYHGDGT